MNMIISTRFKRWIPWIAIGIILLVGAYLRLYNISGYMTFLGDEGRDVLVVKRMIINHRFTLLGPTASVGGFFLGPIYYYFMIPFLWAWHLDPTGPAVMVALFGIATIALVYKVGKDMVDPWVGVMAAALYALSPIVIAYSRSSWNPNLVPFFSTLLVYFLWRVVVKNTWHELFWIGVIIGIGLQLHYLFLFLIAVTFIWFLIYGRQKKHMQYYLLGIAGFVVGFSPFLAFEIRKGFPNTISIFRFLREGKDTGFILSSFLTNISDVSFRLFGRLVIRVPQKELWNGYPAWLIGAWILAVKTTMYTGLGLVAYITIGTIRWPGKPIFSLPLSDHTRRAIVLFAVWFVTIIILFGLYRKGIYEYYFGIFFALPFFLVSLSLWIMAKQKYGIILVIPIFVGLVWLNWEGRPFKFAPNNQLAQTKTISKAVFDLASRKPFNFALVTAGNSDHAYRYFLEIWGNPPVTIENEANDPNRRTVTDQLIVICENPSCQPLGNSLWEIAGFGRAEIAGSLDVPFVKIYKLVHYKGKNS